MKTTIITSLSLVGVLGAGTAAALVNTSIFDSAPQNEAAAFVPGAELVELTLPEPVVMAAADATADPMVNAATTPSPATLTTAAPDPVTPSASLAATATENPSQDDTPVTTAANATDDTAPIESTAPSDSTPATTTPATTAPATTTPPPVAPSLLTTYDLGGAGSVTVDVLDGRMALVDATAAAGWTVSDADIDALTNEVEVELTDGSMIVDFTVGLVDGALVHDIRTEEVANGGYDDEDDDDHDDDDHDDDHDDDDEDDDDDDDDEDDD